MDTPDALVKTRETERDAPMPETPVEYYRGVDLTVSPLVSLVTWDVSAYARREQDRLSSVYRASSIIGGY